MEGKIEIVSKIVDNGRPLSSYHIYLDYSELPEYLIEKRKIPKQALHRPDGSLVEIVSSTFPSRVIEEFLTLGYNVEPISKAKSGPKKIINGVKVTIKKDTWRLIHVVTIGKRNVKDILEDAKKVLDYLEEHDAKIIDACPSFCGLEIKEINDIQKLRDFRK